MDYINKKKNKQIILSKPREHFNDHFVENNILCAALTDQQLYIMKINKINKQSNENLEKNQEQIFKIDKKFEKILKHDLPVLRVFNLKNNLILSVSVQIYGYIDKKIIGDYNLHLWKCQKNSNKAAKEIRKVKFEKNKSIFDIQVVDGLILVIMCDKKVKIFDKTLKLMNNISEQIDFFIQNQQELVQNMGKVFKINIVLGKQQNLIFIIRDKIFLGQISKDLKQLEIKELNFNEILSEKMEKDGENLGNYAVFNENMMQNMAKNQEIQIIESDKTQAKIYLRISSNTNKYKQVNQLQQQLDIYELDYLSGQICLFFSKNINFQDFYEQNQQEQIQNSSPEQREIKLIVHNSSLYIQKIQKKQQQQQQQQNAHYYMYDEIEEYEILCRQYKYIHDFRNQCDDFYNNKGDTLIKKRVLNNFDNDNNIDLQRICISDSSSSIDLNSQGKYSQEQFEQKMLSIDLNSHNHVNNFIKTVKNMGFNGQKMVLNFNNCIEIQDL